MADPPGSLACLICARLRDRKVKARDAGGRQIASTALKKALS
jgi:hypothetical protein